VVAEAQAILAAVVEEVVLLLVGQKLLQLRKLQLVQEVQQLLLLLMATKVEQHL
jgi:hypothetical protein